MATEYETVVGMEIHTELLTRTKVWCGCEVSFGDQPNSHVCPVCMGLPGALPVLNKRSFEYAMRAAIALNCEIAPRTEFERKNYYYPDLPKCYQISQLRKNLGERGWMDIDFDGGVKRIAIDNVHLEEDAGKNIHPDAPGSDYSLVDLNRAGTALLEIVTEPDLRSAAETQAFMETIKNLVEYTDISDCNMHEGRMRFEANISVRPKGTTELGPKVEVKNLASMKIVCKCIEYETERQIAANEAGEKIHQETRLWDDVLSETRSMRSKEEACDYRYFPDPDLIEVVVDDAWIERIRKEVPELPRARRDRFVSEFGIPEYDAHVLTGSKPLANYYEAAIAVHSNPKALSNWIMTEVLREVTEADGGIEAFKIRPEQLGGLVKLIDDGSISGKIGKKVFAIMLEKGGDPAQIVKDEGLVQISDSGAIEVIVDEVLAKNEKIIADLRGGKDKAFGALVGQVMKASRGKANPKMVSDMLKAKLAE